MPLFAAKTRRLRPKIGKISDVTSAKTTAYRGPTPDCPDCYSGNAVALLVERSTKPVLTVCTALHCRIVSDNSRS